MRKALVRTGLFFVFLLVAVAIMAPAPVCAAEQKRPEATLNAQSLSPDVAFRATIMRWNNAIQAARARELAADRAQVLAQYERRKLQRQEQLQRRAEATSLTVAQNASTPGTKSNYPKMDKFTNMVMANPANMLFGSFNRSLQALAKGDGVGALKNGGLMVISPVNFAVSSGANVVTLPLDNVNYFGAGHEFVQF